MGGGFVASGNVRKVGGKDTTDDIVIQRHSVDAQARQPAVDSIRADRFFVFSLDYSVFISTFALRTPKSLHTTTPGESHPRGNCTLMAGNPVSFNVLLLCVYDD